MRMRVKNKAPYAMLVPYFVIYLMFNIFPLLFSFFVSFTNWNGIRPDFDFVGISNYIRAFTIDSQFLKSIWNTILFAITISPLQMIIGFFLAVLLKSFFRRGAHVFQVVNFLPYITTSVALAIIFNFMFTWKGGVINNFLGIIGIKPIYWLGLAWPARIVVITVEVWRNYGYMMVLFMAGLTAIPEELYEAARIDGAGWWKSLLYITLPLLKPTFIFTIITGTNAVLNLFDTPQMVFKSGFSQSPVGGPDRSCLTMMLRFYDASFKNFEFGYGAAIAFVMFAIILGFSLVTLRLSSNKEDF